MKAYTDEERRKYLKKFLELRSKGLSGADAARRVGVSYKALKRWEEKKLYLPEGWRPQPWEVKSHSSGESKSLRADDQQFLPLEKDAKSTGGLSVTFPSGNTIYGTPEALAEVLRLIGGKP